MSQDVSTMAANGTLPVSRRDRERWHPPQTLDREYELTPPTVRDRAAVARAVVAAVGTYPSDDEFRETLRAAAFAALDPEEAAVAIQQLDEFAGLQEAGDKQDPEVETALARLGKAVDRLRDRLSRKDAAVRELIAARSTWIDAWVDHTARATIRDWSGLDAPCIRRGGFVTTDAMLAVPDEDLGPLYARCQQWQELSADQEPDSASP